MEPFQPPRFARRAVWWLAPCLLAVSGAVFAAPAEPGVAESGFSLTNLLVVFLLVLANGFFVASEFALVSVRRTRIDQLAARGNKSAQSVQKALQSLNHFIGAVQVGVTIASLLLGGIGEKSLEPFVAPLLAWMPPAVVGISRAFLVAGLTYFVMTTMHVVLGELVPKALTLQKSESAALLLVRPMMWFARLVWPMVWFLTFLSGHLLRLLGLKNADGHAQVHSSEELDILVAQSHQGGELNDTEAEILHRVVRFSDLTLREVMVPRTEIQGLPLEMPRLALRAWIHSQPHSRVPVYLGSMDEVIGVVHLKDMVPFAAKYGGNDEDAVSLMPLVREALRLPETSTVDKLLGEFKRRRQQMAIVIDEFGGTAGLITLGDLLEQVFGEVADEFDAPEAEIAAHADGRIALSGRTLIDEVNDRYETGFSSDEADTMAGLILSGLGRVAKVGDEVEINGAKLRVEAIDRLKITGLSLLLPPRKESAEADNETVALESH